MAIGSADHVNYHAAPRAPAAWPHQVGVIPSRAQSFQQRAEAQQLRAAVDGGGTAVLGQVLTGMGGVGKTQLAADYATAAWQDGNLDVLVWVTASARSTVVAGYAHAGVELCMADPDDPERAARTFLAWLAPKAGARPCRWLVVLDDVADIDDLRGLWPPVDPSGRTLVTTRRRDAALTGEGRRRIDVGLFTEAEAVAYLNASLAAHGRGESAEQIAALASDLGYLPLALSQASAYLIDSGDEIGDYRSLLADYAATLADTTPDQLPDGQAIPLAAAWSMSVDRADTLRPVGLARPMLHLAALLEPNGIPQAVLTSQPALAHLARNRNRTNQETAGKPARVTRRDAVQVLRALHRLSLIDHTPATSHKAVRVHQLVQRATRDTLTPEERDQFARTAADILLATWPDNERDSALAQAFRDNTAALMHASEHALYRPNAHRVLYRAYCASTNPDAIGQATAARDHYQRLVTATRRHLGPHHRDTLAARHHLAHWRGPAGNAAGAADALIDVVEDMVRVLGDDHPDTLAARHHLAHWRGEAADAAGAADALIDVVEDMVRVLGDDHPETFVARHNLAYFRGEAGDPSGAEATLTELLEHSTGVLGDHHPRVHIIRGNLAHWQGRAGDPLGAAAAFAELLADMARVFGDAHPYTLLTRSSLAIWRGDAGDPSGAADALTEVLEDMVRVFGDDHPHTDLVRDELAWFMGYDGDS